MKQSRVEWVLIASDISGTRIVFDPSVHATNILTQENHGSCPTDTFPPVTRQYCYFLGQKVNRLSRHTGKDLRHPPGMMLKFYREINDLIHPKKAKKLGFAISFSFLECL